MNSTRKIVFGTAALAAAGMVLAQVPAIERVPDGQITCHFLGRLNFDADRTGQYVAYFSRIAGIPDAALFQGEEQNAQTAKLTVVSTELRLNIAREGLLLHAPPIPV